MRDLRESEILKSGHVLSAEKYTDQDEADIEDILGRKLYIELVNQCYNLEGNLRIPDDRPLDAPKCVVKEVENHFATLPTEIPEFDHYTPSLFLMENTSSLRDSLPEFEQALNRFEKLFSDLNSLLE